MDYRWGAKLPWAYTSDRGNRMSWDGDPRTTRNIGTLVSREKCTGAGGSPPPVSCYSVISVSRSASVSAQSDAFYPGRSKPCNCSQLITDLSWSWRCGRWNYPGTLYQWASNISRIPGGWCKTERTIPGFRFYASEGIPCIFPRRSLLYTPRTL